MTDPRPSSKLDPGQEAALASFDLPGRFVGLSPLRRGHIHDTFVSTWDTGEGSRRFIHQRMNEQVFGDLELLMRNIRLVTEHMQARTVQAADSGFEPLQLIPTRAGDAFARLESGSWRTFVFIDQTESHDRCESPEQAYEAARAFGWFQRELLELPLESLGETLVGFFSSPLRYAQFKQALKVAPEARVKASQKWISFVQQRAEMVHLIEREKRRGIIPQRVVHGDTKLNNILFCQHSGKAKGIVDLDTCMPGYSLYDFGDLVRFTAATSQEDERDESQIGTDLELFHALSEGYLSMAGGFLTPREVELMPFSARLVTMTIGMRFLTDYLSGDTYFKISRPGQNLDRAAVQFGMVRFMERHAVELGDT